MPRKFNLRNDFPQLDFDEGEKKSVEELLDDITEDDVQNLLDMIFSDSGVYVELKDFELSNTYSWNNTIDKIKFKSFPITKDEAGFLAQFINHDEYVIKGTITTDTNAFKPYYKATLGCYYGTGSYDGWQGNKYYIMIAGSHEWRERERKN